MRLELEQVAPAPPPIDSKIMLGLAGTGNSNFDKVLGAGIAAAQSGNRAQARILLQYAVEIDPQSEAGWLWLASISEYPEELLAFLDHVLMINPKNGRAVEWRTATNQLMAKTFVQRGIDASKEGRNDLALQCFDTALTYDEQNQLAWFWKDSMSKEETVESVPADDSGPTLAGKRSIAAIIIQAKALLAEDDRQQALALVNEAIAVDPHSEKAWLLRSHLVDDFDEKRMSLQRVIEINPENETGRAALETLLAMVETVAPDPELKREPATERLLNTPFDQVAQPIVSDHENSPTQELELPEAIKENNPFLSNDNHELPADVWAPVIEKTEAGESDLFTEEYPVIEISHDAGSSQFEQPEDWNNYEVQPLVPENYSPSAADHFFFPQGDQTSAKPETQDVSAAAYLEETEESSQLPPVDENYLSGASWSEENHDANIYQTDEEDPVWVIDESETFEIHENSGDAAKTILVVDDSPVVRKLIAGKLEESGYKVISAGSGAEAMNMISNWAPDLILLDIAMPKMDGYQVCENIRKNRSTKNVPVVLISGKDGYYDEDRAQKAGTSSFISKPFGPETLMRAMEMYLPCAELIEN